MAIGTRTSVPSRFVAKASSLKRSCSEAKPQKAKPFEFATNRLKIHQQPTVCTCKPELSPISIFDFPILRPCRAPQDLLPHPLSLTVPPRRCRVPPTRYLPSIFRSKEE